MRRFFFPFMTIACCIYFSFGQEKTGGRSMDWLWETTFTKPAAMHSPTAAHHSSVSPCQKILPVSGTAASTFLWLYFFGRVFYTISSWRNEQSLDPKGRLSLYMKTAYLEWKNLVPKSSFYVGLVPTPTWINVEGQWGIALLKKRLQISAD